MAPGQLGGCTTVLGRFTIHGSCELKIAAAETRSRRLSIEALDAIELRLVMDADGREITTRAKIEAGKKKDIFVGKDGQSLALSCQTGTTCRASIQ
ncbi:MAG TPA: hypothetical protein VN253_06060 [Kofleriaceae bacterium]|nr:hypothetical protein [Kofleriaceae bacterium]